MKVLVTGDTHFGLLRGRTAESKRKFSDYLFTHFKEIVDKELKNNIDLVVHVGDIFNRSKPPKKIISKTFDSFNKIIEKDIPLFIIPGNHDKSYIQEPIISFFNKNFRIFNSLRKMEMDEFAMVAFPYSKTPKASFLKAVKLLNKSQEKTKLIFCHQLFKGSSFGPLNFTFIKGERVIDTETIPENTYVYTGHVHKAQSLKNKVFYCGSPERVSFVESIEPKGYIRVFIEDDLVKTEFVETKTAKMRVIEESVKNKNVSEIDGLENISKNEHILLRLVGRKIRADEIDFLNDEYPKEEFPYFYFSPRNPEIILKELYSRKNSVSYETFNFFA